MLIHSYQLCPVEAFFKERPDTKNRCSDDACNDFLVTFFSEETLLVSL